MFAFVCVRLVGFVNVLVCVCEWVSVYACVYGIGVYMGCI